MATLRAIWGNLSSLSSATHCNDYPISAGDNLDLMRRRRVVSTVSSTASRFTNSPLSNDWDLQNFGSIKHNDHCMRRRPSAVAQEQAASAAVPPPCSATEVVHLYRTPLLSPAATASLLRLIEEKVSDSVESVATETCFNLALTAPLSAAQDHTLHWLLRETYEADHLTPHSVLAAGEGGEVVEVGPRLSFTTAWSANAVAICHACGLPQVARIERSRRYQLRMAAGAAPLSEGQLATFRSLVHDRMTEAVYAERLESFETNVVPAPVLDVAVMEGGRGALEAINKEMGLAFDEWDLDFYTHLFRNDIKRNPTDVELFDIAQSNSEHSRHWFFKGKLVVDGVGVEETLMGIVRDTLTANPNNSVIGFNDNSSAIRGYPVQPLLPVTPGSPGPLAPLPRDLDILFTAETHNFPCAVAPFPGAETGAGGRIRDTHATGTGSLVVAATAGYCVGNLQLEGGVAPWEDPLFAYPSNLAPPLKILVDASDGASDYGNKFGEPVIQGYTRSFGMRLPNGERREWLKPIMFSAGIGQIDHGHLVKGEADVGMLVVKLGGPAYRIGMGGGAASSMVSGTRDAELDFNAVQRGDAEMAQKLYRVVRTCVEMGAQNPIVSIHDQGAGGNCNVVKEIIYPLGAQIDIRSVVVGDATMSVLEIWGAEYQEQDALLLRPHNRALLKAICEREQVSMAVIGSISGDGRVVLVDSWAVQKAEAEGQAAPRNPVELDLEKVLGDMPQKTFTFTRQPAVLEPLEFPPGVTAATALQRVLRLPSVGSKRFLTTKVDRCVSGLVAQQQTVGPLQLPLADVAVIAQTHTGTTGAACAIGEQPIKGLLNPEAMARLALGEALTNLMWAKVSALSDVKVSANWMYAAKMGGEGAAMYDAARALRGAMLELQVAVDGGKDSLSMAAQAGGETVMAPGNLVISAYVTCPDITLTVTPDLKLGEECPDVRVGALKAAFEVVQELIEKRHISAGHDVSDGGLVTALLEMGFAGDCGLTVDLPPVPSVSGREGALAALFAEELGLVLEVSAQAAASVLQAFEAAGVPCAVIGSVDASPAVSISVGGKEEIVGDIRELRDAWEATSFALEALQRSELCVEAEREGLKHRTAPTWTLPFTPTPTPQALLRREGKPRVAVVREEGSNGDREMASMVYAAGMEPWDVAMTDLRSGKVTLKGFRGVVFVGGFSYADVLDSGKGWAGTIRFNPRLLEEFQAFYDREDTFSLGVCNGCQLMALLGWIPGGESGDAAQPRFVHNESGRFECRFSSVAVLDSPAIMLRGMAGTTVGVWVAHGEGRALFPDPAVFTQVKEQNLAPVRYCNDEGAPTEAYPFNPNGSPEGIAALCSPNGRHLALMPHPERSYLMWQLPWIPKELAGLDPRGPSPWLRMWQNAREWCEGA